MKIKYFIGILCILLLIFAVSYYKSRNGKVSIAANYEIIPGVGIGPIKFGMSKEEVIRYIGEPEGEMNDGISLMYPSKGFTIVIYPQSGVNIFNCYTKQAAPPNLSTTDFNGKTKNDIAMGSTESEIKLAFGKPDHETIKGRQTNLSYDNLRMEFILLDNKLVQFFMRTPAKSKCVS